jgi:uncharacterized protein YhdP
MPASSNDTPTDLDTKATSAVSAAASAAHETLRMPSRRRRSVWAVLLLLLVIVAVLSWLTLQWGILPNIDRWREPIARHLSARLGAQVSFGALRAPTRAGMPQFEIDDLVVRDAQGREALRVAGLKARASWRSLRSSAPALDRLDVVRAFVDVRRDPEGRLHVAGRPVDEAGAGEDDPMQLLARLGSLTVRDSAVRWQDERRGAPPLVFSAVEMSTDRPGRELRVEALPPPAWGERIRVTARAGVRDEASKAARREGFEAPLTIDIDVPRLDLGQLRTQVDLPLDIGSGSVRVSGRFDVEQRRVRAVAADVAFEDVDVRMDRDAPALDVRSLATRVQATRGERSSSLMLEGLTFTTADGQTWPRGDLKLDLQGPEQAPEAGSLTAQRVDLAIVSLVATRLALAPQWRQRLLEMQPRGQAEQLSIAWQGPLTKPVSYVARATVSQLALNAQPVVLTDDLSRQRLGRPGVEGANVEIEATHDGGQAHVKIAKGSASFPGVFERPRVALDAFDAQLRWTLTPAADAQGEPQLSVVTRGATFANADAQGRFDATWRSGPGQGFGKQGRFPGALDLKGQLTRARAAAVARYLPLGLPSKVRDYVGGALLDGRLTQGSFAVRGDLFDFPFGAASTRVGNGSAPRGEFKFVGRVEGGRMNILPDAPPAQAWPLLEQVSGEIAFDRTAMTLREGRGVVLGVPVTGVEGGIANLADTPTLELRLQAQAAIDALIDVTRRSPINGYLGGALSEATGRGDARLAAALRVPIERPRETGVDGHVDFDGGDLRMRPDVPTLAELRGRALFTDKGLSIPAATARLHGEAVEFEGGSRADGSLQFKGRGSITAESFAQAKELGFVTRLSAFMQGRAPYELTLAFKQGQPEYVVTSTMQGMAVKLPAPLGKDANSVVPLRVASTLVADRAADNASLSEEVATDTATGASPARARRATRDVLRIDIGGEAGRGERSDRSRPPVHVHYVRDITQATAKVLAGGIGVGEPAPQPDRGVHANIKLDAIDVDAWQVVGRKLGLIGPSQSQGAGPAGAADDGGYAPERIALNAQRLSIEKRRMTQVTAGLSRVGVEGGWQATLDADQLAGHAQWHPARGREGARIQARLSRLSLPEAAVESVDAMLGEDASEDPPALDIVVEDFELRGRKLGRVDVVAVHEHDATGSLVWRLDELTVRNPEATFDATGRWAVAADGSGRQRMVLDFNLALRDSGELLTRFGQVDLIRGGRGTMSGQVSWEGSPLTWHTPSLAGNVKLAIDEGQFLKAGPGAARLLGVLNLQSLPRRLLLDFRDVFSDGFAFDNIVGDVGIERGLASTNNVRMRGVQAVVLMEGNADVTRETQDLRVWVVPEINAGTASLAYAVVNPAVGLGTFLAQLFLRRPLMEATTREFRVQGSWVDPKVERVDRNPGDRMPDFDADPTEAVINKTRAAAPPVAATPPAMAIPVVPAPSAPALPATDSAPAASERPAPSAR